MYRVFDFFSSWKLSILVLFLNLLLFLHALPLGALWVFEKCSNKYFLFLVSTTITQTLFFVFSILVNLRQFLSNGKLFVAIRVRVSLEKIMRRSGYRSWKILEFLIKITFWLFGRSSFGVELRTWKWIISSFFVLVNIEVASFVKLCPFFFFFVGARFEQLLSCWGERIWKLVKKIHFGNNMKLKWKIEDENCKTDEMAVIIFEMLKNEIC